MKTFLNILLLVPFFALGQNDVGLIRYGEIQSMGMGSPVGSDYNSILIFDTDKSLYITRQDSLEGKHKFKINTYSNGEASFTQTYATNEKGFRYYFDRVKDTSYSRDIGFWRVKEKTPHILWELKTETKKIGKFICKKATTRFRGRNYTAWYATEIPLPYGPWKLQGLPGVILEAYDTNKEIFWYFKSLEYPGNFSFLLKNISNKKNQWIPFQEYKDFLIRNFKETIVNTRMAVQSAGIEATSQNNSMLNSYIEGFDINKK